jgi:HK97 family phage portal protein
MARTDLIRVIHQQAPATWFQRMVYAIRSRTLGPWSISSKELAAAMGSHGGTSAGVPVDEFSALRISPVAAGVGLISDDVSSLPLEFYRRLSDGGKERFLNHSLYRLLHSQPNSEMSTMVWRRTMQAHVLIWRNAYAEIERDSAYRPVAIWPLVPERVNVLRDGAGTLKYSYRNPSGGEVIYDAADMIHLVGQSHDGSVGSTLVEQARESFGLTLAAEKFGSTFFGNGATFGGVIAYKGPKPTQPAQDNLDQVLAARHQGVDRAHKLLALYNDATYTRIGIPPNDAQFLETRTFQLREVCRWLKIPPPMLADLADATFSNVEQLRQFYLESCIRPWLVLWEQELARKLIAPLEQNIQAIEHNVEGFLRADSVGRSALYTSQFNVGGITPNEIRALENRNPKAGGDRLFVMRNMVPLDRLDEIIDAEIAKTQAAPPGLPQIVPAAPKTASDPAEIEARMAEHAKRLSEETERAVKAETRRDELLAQVAGLQADRDAALQMIQVKEEAIRALDQTHLAAMTVANRVNEEHASAERTAFEQKRAALVRDLEEAQIAKAETIAEKVAALAALDSKRLADMQALQETATQDAAAQRIAFESERAALVRGLTEAQAAKNDTDVMLGVAERERDAAKTSHAELSDRAANLMAQLLTVEGERNELLLKLTPSEALNAELRSQVAKYEEMAQGLQKALLETEARAVSEETKAKALNAAAADREQLQRAAEARLAAVRSSHRALLVDTIERLLYRECERARKAQQTPEKLQGWVDRFYPIHEDACRAALRPVLLAWAACTGLDAEALLEREVTRHIDESRRGLTDVAQTDDGEEMAAALARLLTRWETERAERVADRLIQEGEAACRT